jgi:hypothetical protein
MGIVPKLIFNLALQWRLAKPILCAASMGSSVRAISAPTGVEDLSLEELLSHENILLYAKTRPGPGLAGS